MNSETKTMEFNTIKTIKLINKDKLLKIVYSNKEGEFNFNKLIEIAEKNTLNTSSVSTLKEIYENIIIHSESHKVIYDKIEVKNLKPRRYGKLQILADIEKQGGVPTSLQNTMLELARLKSITTTLLARGTSDRFNGTNKLDDERQRKIKATIRDVKTKLEAILNNNDK